MIKFLILIFFISMNVQAINCRMVLDRLLKNEVKENKAHIAQIIRPITRPMYQSAPRFAAKLEAHLIDHISHLLTKLTPEEQVFFLKAIANIKFRKMPLEIQGDALSAFYSDIRINSTLANSFSGLLTYIHEVQHQFNYYYFKTYKNPQVDISIENDEIVAEASVYLFIELFFKNRSSVESRELVDLIRENQEQFQRLKQEIPDDLGIDFLKNYSEDSIIDGDIYHAKKIQIHHLPKKLRFRMLFDSKLKSKIDRLLEAYNDLNDLKAFYATYNLTFNNYFSDYLRELNTGRDLNFHLVNETYINSIFGELGVEFK